MGWAIFYGVVAAIWLYLAYRYAVGKAWAPKWGPVVMAILLALYMLDAATEHLPTPTTQGQAQ